eukprot:gene27024-2251_t
MREFSWEPSTFEPLVEEEEPYPGWQAIEEAKAEVDGELSPEEWVDGIRGRAKQCFVRFIQYLKKFGAAMLESVGDHATNCTQKINYYRIAHYWMVVPQTGDMLGDHFGPKCFVLDMHLTSEACGRACPKNCPHCATPESLANELRKKVDEAAKRAALDVATKERKQVEAAEEAARLAKRKDDKERSQKPPTDLQ